MTRRISAVFVFFLFIFFLQKETVAVWIKKQGKWVWTQENVLGATSTDEVVYVVRSASPSPTPTPTDTPTPTPTPTDTPTPTLTPTPTRAAAAGPRSPGQAPTAVTVTSFRAQWAGNGVSITWATATEINNMGFNLYRSTDRNGTYTKINNPMIYSTCLGCITGANYSYTDIYISLNQTYYYKLQAVDSQNRDQMFGPESVTTPLPTATPTRVPTPTQIPTPTPLPCGTRYCTEQERCLRNVCRSFCAPDGSCLGDYYCTLPEGVCAPVAVAGVSASYAPQYPTATPPVGNNQIVPTTSGSGYSPYIYPTTLPTPTPAPTNIYPTRPPSSSTYFNNPNPDLPTPAPAITSIPSQLKGKASTIVIELPAAPASSSNPLAIAPTPASIILKGEDLKEIVIGAFKPVAAHAETPKGTTSQQIAQLTEKNNDLNIVIEKKQGTGIAISQQEFVIQKGPRSVTITSNSQNAGVLSIDQNDTKATVSMPISIDPTTNIMTIDTPTGPMKVSIMPDDAVAIVRQLKVINQNGTPNTVALEVRNNQLEYKIKAEKSEKLLWIIPVTIPRDIYVSADTGGVIAVKKSFLYGFISLFTF